MGAGNADDVTDKEKDESISKNLDDKSKTAGGAGRRVTGGSSRFAQFKEDHFGFSDNFTSVDAATTVNSVNTSNPQGNFKLLLLVGLVL